MSTPAENLLDQIRSQPAPQAAGAQGANVVAAESLALSTGQTVIRALVNVRQNVNREVWLVANGSGGYNIAVVNA